MIALCFQLTVNILLLVLYICLVQSIMYPEVPMTMRMSSHLLFGFVPIYSEQVESFFRDSNTLLAEIGKAFTSTDLMINLSRATFRSVLPNKFKLDSLDIDTDLSER